MFSFGFAFFAKKVMFLVLCLIILYVNTYRKYPIKIFNIMSYLTSAVTSFKVK